jgi:glycosyltransferase involved in cell wall biosynthesis
VHILLIHQAFAALNEAGGTRHIEMARCLVQRGHRVTVIASPVNYLSGKTRTVKIPWVERQEVEPGITVLRSYTYPAFHRSFVHRVFGFFSFMVSSFFTGLSIRRVDLVWGTSPPIFQGFTSWLLARIKGCPFLFEVRDLWPAFAIAIGVLRNPLLIHLSKWLEHFLYTHADQVIINSPGFLEHVSRNGAVHVELIPNGADPEMFSIAGDGAAFRCENHLEGKFIILYAGAHGMSNDLGVLLQAAARLRNHAEIHLVLIGDGKEKKALQAQAVSLGLKNILFLPPVPKTEMPLVLAASNACVAILKPLDMYKTTYPNKVFDYMAAGRPVLLAIDGVIRTVVEAAEAGVAVPPGDPEAMANSILTLASNPIQAQRMGLQGRSYIEANFNRNLLAEKLALLMEELGRS